MHGAQGGIPDHAGALDYALASRRVSPGCSTAAHAEQEAQLTSHGICWVMKLLTALRFQVIPLGAWVVGIGSGVERERKSICRSNCYRAGVSHKAEACLYHGQATKIAIMTSSDMSSEITCCPAARVGAAGRPKGPARVCAHDPG